MTERGPCVYLLASGYNGALYVGVTSDLMKRLHQHRTGAFDGHTKRYDIARLVWYEMADTMEAAITYEKKLKRWRREWKRNLIERANPAWNDLAMGLGFEPLPLPDRHPGPGPGSTSGHETRPTIRPDGGPRTKSGVTGVCT